MIGGRLPLERPTAVVSVAEPGGPPLATGLRTPGQHALVAVELFENALTGALPVIAVADFGPYNLSGSCDYDCFLGICLKSYSWTWPLDLSGMRQPLSAGVEQVQQDAAAYETAFAPTRSWLTSDLGPFSAVFTAQTDTILTINREIGPGGVPTPAQKAAIAAAFSTIIAGIGQGQAALNTAVQAMAQFNTAMAGHQNDLADLLSTYESDYKTWAQNDQSVFAQQMPCGGGDFDNQVNGALATFESSCATIKQSFDEVALRGQRMQDATAELVGTLENIVNDYAGVLAEIDNAETFPTGPIQELHLEVAQKEWAELAEAAGNIP